MHNMDILFLVHTDSEPFALLTLLKGDMLNVIQRGNNKYEIILTGC